MRWQQSRQFKHHAHGHRQVAVAKLRHACERIRSERGGRKTRIERAERENKSELVKAHRAVEMPTAAAGVAQDG